MRLCVILSLLLVALSGPAWAQTTCPTTSNATPQLTAGGSVFGRLSSQWNQYFGSKADANNGTLCNPVLINPSFQGLPPANRVELWGCKGDGVTDDTTCLNNATGQVAAAGGGLLYAYAQYLVDSNNVTIPAGVTLVGPWPRPGLVGNGGNYAVAPGSLIVNPSYTVRVLNGAGLENIIVRRKGLLNPGAVGTTAAQNLQTAYAQHAAFAGTGVTVGNGTVGSGDSAIVRNVLTLGFSTCLSTSDNQLPVLDGVWGDCDNGIYAANIGELGVISRGHFWPFLNYGGPTPMTGGQYQNGVSASSVYFYNPRITGIANNGSGLIRVAIGGGHNFQTGNGIIVTGEPSNTDANGPWTATLVDGTHVDLQGSTFANAASSITQAANGSFLTAQPVIPMATTAGFFVGAQCSDATKPSAFPANVAILSIQTNVSITLASNTAAASGGSADSITCDTGGSAAANVVLRTGDGLFLNNTTGFGFGGCDQCAVDNFDTFGYENGFHVKSVDHVRIVHSRSDSWYPPAALGLPNTTGLLAEGTTSALRFSDGDLSAAANLVQWNATGGQVLFSSIANGDLYGCGLNAINVTAGSLTLTGGMIDNSPPHGLLPTGSCNIVNNGGNLTLTGGIGMSTDNAISGSGSTVVGDAHDYTNVLLGSSVFTDNVAIAFAGVPGASQAASNIFGGTANIVGNSTRSRCIAAVASTGTAVFTLKDNGSSFGTVTFTSGTTGVIANSAAGFAPGGVFSVVAPASPDATLSGITCSFSFSPS